MTARQFRQECNAVSKKLLGFDCFDSDNSYDCEALLDDALKRNVLPEAFVRDAFSDDLSRAEWDRQLLDESCDEMEDQ